MEDSTQHDDNTSGDSTQLHQQRRATLNEYKQKQLASLLNRDRLKLWESPYTTDGGQQGDIPDELVSRYAGEIGEGTETTRVLFENLRLHALQKLAERQKYQTSGMATLKVKVTGGQQGADTKDGRKVLPVEINLGCTGSQLKSRVSELLGRPSDQLKLICTGKVVTDNQPLSQQNIKNGSQIMVLMLTVSQAAARQRDRDGSQVQDTRHAAELLSARAEKDTDTEMDIQIADQSGKPLDLPAEERKALTLAMTLHEKGRQAMKRKHTTLALPLLLEADKEFKCCRAAILDSVDNYAVLCLDIVWCYLCLRDIDDLPDAVTRLQKSEEFFKRSYGADMERLVAIKGNTGQAAALIMRLHLLQGVVAFHQNRRDECVRYLRAAGSDLKRLQIDKDKLTEVMAMGFSEAEARLGLRSSDGDIARAVAHIMKRKEEKAENAKKRKEERRRKSLTASLGKTAAGHSVNVAHYEQLISMGYPRGAAAEAIRQANNDITCALEVLQNHPEFLSLPDPERKGPLTITDDMLVQVCGLGFDPEMARRALLRLDGDILRAVDILVNSAGQLPPPTEGPSTSAQSPVQYCKVVQRAVDALVNSGGQLPPPTNAPSTSSQSPGHTQKSPEKIREELEDAEAIKRLVEDFPEDEEDYLDLTLTEEADILAEYTELLHGLGVSPL